MFHRHVSSLIREFSLPESPITNGHWHHVCITWTSTNGEWKFYVDGLKREGRSSQAGQEVAGGILAIGQMLAGQGSIGSESSLTGLLSRFNVWDKFMADAAVERIADACSPESGNVVPWPDVYVRISGHVTKRASSLCSFPGWYSSLFRRKSKVERAKCVTYMWHDVESISS